jgi:hypothetical protein
MHFDPAIVSAIMQRRAAQGTAMDYSKTFNDLILEAWERFSDGEPDNKLELRASEFIDKVRETVLDDINSTDRILEILKNQL